MGRSEFSINKKVDSEVAEEDKEDPSGLRHHVNGISATSSGPPGSPHGQLSSSLRQISYDLESMTFSNAKLHSTWLHPDKEGLRCQEEWRFGVETMWVYS